MAKGSNSKNNKEMSGKPETESQDRISRKDKREVKEEESKQPQESEKKGQGKGRRRPPRLERKYGYFHCHSCRAVWESSWVWCVRGTPKVYYKQDCRQCKQSYNPYRVEDLVCSECGWTDCICEWEGTGKKCRNIDTKKKHRTDLCGKCKSGYLCAFYWQSD